jgi:pantoate--beta-alanine ligase
MDIITSPGGMSAWSDLRRRTGATIGLVPTMGYLHAGHSSLMRFLRPRVDYLVVSIYVNPLQFAPHEDLETYPTDTANDLACCRDEGVDCVFMPENLYPTGFATTVTVSGLADHLCGQRRPTHFQGVATVVARLFGLTRCDQAVFGEKDYQQLVILRRMVRDLGMPVKIMGAPLVRETDGLALSSRNSYLTPLDRLRSTSLHRAMSAMATAAREGTKSVGDLQALGRTRIDCDQLDYLEVVDSATLQPLQEVSERARIMISAFYGKTRLIDNMSLETPWT